MMVIFFLKWLLNIKDLFVAIASHTIGLIYLKILSQISLHIRSPSCLHMFPFRLFHGQFSHECYAIIGHPNLRLHFLQFVIWTWRHVNLFRQKKHYSHLIQSPKIIYGNRSWKICNFYYSNLLSRCKTNWQLHDISI
jgi:hypothetical protein